MNQELMTLDFWQDTVIYEGKTFPVGTLACDALNVPADAIAKMNELSLIHILHTGTIEVRPRITVIHQNFQVCIPMIMGISG